jgi:hypothetical protein
VQSQDVDSGPMISRQASIRNASKSCGRQISRLFKTDNQSFPEEVLPNRIISRAPFVRFLRTPMNVMKERVGKPSGTTDVSARCGFDFEATYGSIGEVFIHVHHVVLLSSTGKEDVVNPKTDLLPVCPNCHGILRRKSPPYLVEELCAQIRH